MSQRRHDSLRGVLLDTTTIFSITEFCEACGTDRTTVVKMVDEGVIEAQGRFPEWQFHGEALVRARRAVRLIDDLRINLPGAALALDLLERLERLEAMVAPPTRPGDSSAR